MLFFQGLILLALGYLIYTKISKKKNSLLETIFVQHGLWWVFILSLISLITSLIFSEFYGVEPCALCWLQRLCIYPQVLISAIVLFFNGAKKERAWSFIFSLSVAGFLLASYQTLEQFRVNFLPKAECVTGPDAACSQINMMEFGYITFPLCSAFLLFFIILLFTFQKTK